MEKKKGVGVPGNRLITDGSGERMVDTIGAARASVLIRWTCRQGVPDVRQPAEVRLAVGASDCPDVLPAHLPVAGMRPAADQSAPGARARRAPIILKEELGIGGKRVVKTIKTFEATWPPAGGRIRVVIVRDRDG
jgi:hypothetical protein